MRFLPSHSFVTGSGEPAQWLMFVHGMYGRGGNWRTAARKVLAACPGWGAVLVDLRMHGKSQEAPPPHTVQSAAADVVRLIDQLREAGKPVAALSGHSFGGKVALGVRAMAPNGLRHIWVLDASPSVRPGAMGDPANTVGQVLDQIAALPASFADRAAFVTLMKSKGFAKPLSQWLAMNLEPHGDGYRFGLDAGAMADLLSSYYDADMWPAVEDAASPAALHVVAAGASDSVPEDDRQYLADIASRDPKVSFEVIEGASHWLHMDALDALVELMSAQLIQAS